MIKMNWIESWKVKVEKREKFKKDWNKAAINFDKRATGDDYHEKFLNKLIIDENDSVLDLGCGEGSLTIPIAKKAGKVTGLDASYKMLELLNKKDNSIHTILKDISKINYDELGDYDVVIASRCLNGIKNIDEVLETMNKIANKYVFLTVFGPNNWEFENNFFKSINHDRGEYPDYNYIFNILFDMGIYANIERLDIKIHREYDSIEEAMNNGKFMPNLLNDEEKVLLREYLEKNLKVKNNKYYSKKDKSDWILIWWKKE